MAAGRPRHVFISCGEASGDRYGAALCAALRARDPELRITALAGPRTAAAGAELVRDSSDLAVMGFAEVLGQARRLLRARREAAAHLRGGNVDVFVPIDFPGFNSHLAGRARRAGVPVFWLVAPQVWAWGGWRTGGLRRRIDRLGTVLPFEADWFAARGFDVFAMGHPLMEDYGGAWDFEGSIADRERAFDARDGALTLALLPGSRRQELDQLLPVLRIAARAAASMLPGRRLQPVVSCAPGLDAERIAEVFAGGASVSRAPLPELLRRADLALVCSGTASLEAALAGVPHEIVYRTGRLNYWLARRLVHTGHIGLSNLILDESLVREHIQEQAAPLPVATGLVRWVARPSERKDFYGAARRLRAACGGPGVWTRTAAAVLDLAAGGG
ncbi:MAG: lipid-A-disaccharide synthase, partial [Candidatus Krumholzibacteriia bacterium]